MRNVQSLLAMVFATGTLNARAEVPLIGQAVATVPGQNPLYVTHAPGDFSRIFAVGQYGGIWIVRIPEHELEATPFLSVPNVATGGERGLLGLAFHPEYEDNGYFYVYYNAATESGRARVSRFTRSETDIDIADPASEYVVLKTGGGGGVHNGGWIAFGPEGYLYILTGDSGDADNAQDLTANLLGKMLRIDVDRDDFPSDVERNYGIPPNNPYVSAPEDDEIWIAGLRNPWRACFDLATGDIFIGDVGQAEWEEIDFVPAGVGGLNFGWPCYEGFAALADPALCPPSPQLTFPIVAYSHSEGVAVTGGEIYRGCAAPPVDGRYFYGDYLSHVRSFRYVHRAVADRMEHPEIAAYSIGFGRDAFGEIYTCRDGIVRKIVPAVPIGRDCNANGVADRCDILAGISADFDTDGVPDDCPAAGDVNSDGIIDVEDLAALLSAFGACAGEAGYNANADFAGSGCIELDDLATLLPNFGG